MTTRPLHALPAPNLLRHNGAGRALVEPHPDREIPRRPPGVSGREALSNPFYFLLYLPGPPIGSFLLQTLALLSSLLLINASVLADPRPARAGGLHSMRRKMASLLRDTDMPPLSQNLPIRPGTW